MQKFLIIAGVLLITAGALWPWLSKLGLGRLPGDILIERENGSFYFPIVTMLLISIILTILLKFLGK